jgi:hypothetical protein
MTGPDDHDPFSKRSALRLFFFVLWWLGILA